MWFLMRIKDYSMKTTLLCGFSRITSALAFAMLVGAPLPVRADDTQKPSSNDASTTDKSARGGKIRQRILERFDKNHNGKLDPDERQALKKAIEERRGKGAGKPARS